MYKIINSILADRQGDIIFKCFGIWHIIYLVIILGALLTALLILRKRSEKTKKIAIEVVITTAFVLYMAEFFLMPFAYGYIDVEKLPFHICTVSCILCFLSRHNKFLSKFKLQFAIIGLIGNFIYIFYPAGVEWKQVHPVTYRVIQTLIYHGLMAAYGLFVLTFEEKKLDIKKCYKDVIIILILVSWALLGNNLYNGFNDDYTYKFNWFFVVKEPFGIIDLNISKFIMPFFMPVFLFSLDLLIRGIYYLFKRPRKAKA